MHLTDNDLEEIRQGKPVAKDYYYVPVITYNDQADASKSSSLVFMGSRGGSSQTAYGSKVPANTTLTQSIGKDLQRDFGYPSDGSFKVEHIKLHDNTDHHQGNTLSRLMVRVIVSDKFDAAKVHPLGLTVSWHNQVEGTHSTMPSIPRDQFLTEFFTVVAKERVREHIAPEELISLAIIVDNEYINAMFAGDDAHGFPVADVVSGCTNSVMFYYGYAEAPSSNFTTIQLDDKVRHFFDLSKPATIVAIGNVNLALSIHRSPETIANYADAAAVRLPYWDGAGQLFVDRGETDDVSDGVFALHAHGQAPDFDEQIFRSTEEFSRAMNFVNGYSHQTFDAILTEARKYGGLEETTDTETKAHLLPQSLTILDTIEDDAPYVAYGFRCSWSSYFTVVVHRATVVNASNLTK